MASLYRTHAKPVPPYSGRFAYLDPEGRELGRAPAPVGGVWAEAVFRQDDAGAWLQVSGPVFDETAETAPTSTAAGSQMPRDAWLTRDELGLARATHNRR